MKEEKSNFKRVKPAKFSDAFKKEVVEEYLKSGRQKTVIEKKYGIRSHGSIGKWLAILGYEDPNKKEVNLELTNYSTLAKRLPQTKSSSNAELEAKIRLLERQLEDEQLRSEMYARMIDLAEKMYKIPVRKNYNTK